MAFTAKWEHSYDAADIAKRDFTCVSDKRVSANFLHSTEAGYLTCDHAIGFIKPYENNHYALATLLPDSGISLRDYSGTLSGEVLLKTLSNPDIVSVDTAIPKFKHICSVDLTPIMKNLCITDLFDKTAADFSNLCHINDPDYRVFVSDISQQTYIDLNETGTTAYALTQLGFPHCDPQ